MPLFEVKVNYLIKTLAGYLVSASIYRTSDPISDGIDPRTGVERFHINRTLLYQDERTAPLGTTKTQVINFLKAKMQQYNLDHGSEFVAGDFYVVFGNFFT